MHDTTKGRIIVLDRDDLIECSVLLKSAVEKKIDRIHIPTNCLDVLAQQIYGIAISDIISISDLLKMIKQSYPYHNLSEGDFLDVINYLSGEYVSLEDRHVYAKIWYDKETGMIGKRGKLARVIYMTNIGTIPDESYVKVKVGEQIIGEIDEAFLEKLKRGDVFVLGGEKYEFLYSRGMTAFVSASVYKPPTIPSWFSEMLPLSFDLAMDIQKFRKLMEGKLEANMSKEDVIKFIHDYLYVDKNAANAIYEYFNEQFMFAKIPNERRILIEHYNDEKRKYIVFHTLYGRRVNDCLSRAVAFVISRIQKRDVEIGINDNGFYIVSEKNIQAKRAFDVLKSEKLDMLLNASLEKTEVLKRRFRHCATRSLMILRNYKGRKKRVGRQQISSQILINAVKKISNDFSILKEARREILEDLMDIENATKIIKDIEGKIIKVEEFHTDIPSPFAFNLVLSGYVDLLKMEDKIDFLKRMHQMVKAKIGLRK
ncbi:hypothetical protein HQ529_02680 [Candidatus Woesearchaeota archaeon]|nr:hypothetical protein [Candidatus Woesearchaeota archaeon]